jgi:hypothetical protein
LKNLNIKKKKNTHSLSMYVFAGAMPQISPGATDFNGFPPQTFPGANGFQQPTVAQPSPSGDKKDDDAAESGPEAPKAYAQVGFAEIFTQFVLLGWTAFGGPQAHIALFQKIFIEKLNWMSTSLFMVFSPFLILFNMISCFELWMALAGALCARPMSVRVPNVYLTCTAHGLGRSSLRSANVSLALLPLRFVRYLRAQKRGLTCT